MQTSNAEKISTFHKEGWWEDQTLYSMFATALASAPGRCALADPPDRSSFSQEAPKRYTYAELADKTEQLAEELYTAGVRRDDILVIQLPNTVEIVILYLAISRIGAIASPVPMQYGLHELTHIAATLKPKAFISTNWFKGQNSTEAHKSAFDADTLILSIGQDIGADESTAVKSDDFAAYLAGLEQSGDDIFTICWTSGTTGRPKGVPRSYNHWRNSMVSCEDSVSLTEGDVLLNPFPFVNMASIGGFLFVWLNIKGTLVLHHPFDPTIFLQQLQTESVVYTIAPPAVLSHLNSMPGIFDKVDLSKLKFILSGSAPLAPDMVRGFKEKVGIDVINVFGSNEGCTLASCSKDVPDPETRATCFPRYGVSGFDWHNRMAHRMRSVLRDPDTNEEITEPGIKGELRIAGPAVFDGYYNSPEDNALVFDEHGYFRTGDLFEITGDGNAFYKFVGRCKDLIVRGGMNISPEELDILLDGHPDILEAAVVGYPDTLMGEKVAAVVVPMEGKSLELDDITDFLRAKDVAVFKLPEKLISVDKLPRNPLNKVVRSELKDLI
ncbi:2,3-dihydroxybenzoate-AMP ligase [Kordiimonas sediminis]|uniref:2,3-dihydroxybenzoate-AMP ligase n=1 Tax=Kordiimonas sediminis TaxID=1735581 RepID=A0A919E6E7_9PROT|nr:class I adenylate-forming enzyme family protein [Kordiimonas sediminis]GHF17585.1 2,3-dihydroxybenzoate-AMP ligase [Kordiimonas sediminis]